MLCSLFPLCSKVEKMISKEIMHLQYHIKKSWVCPSTTLAPCIIKFTILQSFPSIDFRYYLYINIPRMSFSSSRGNFNRNNAFRLHDQHIHALAQEPSPGGHEIYNIVKFSSLLVTIYQFSIYLLYAQK